MKVTRRYVFGTLLVGGGIASVGGIEKIYRAYSDPDLEELGKHITVIEDLIDAILPSTKDSISTREARVASFVVYAIRNCTSRQSQNNFVTGLETAIKFARKKFGKSVAECTAEERIALLNYFEDNATQSGSLFVKLKKRVLGEEFIFTLKKLAIWGFCSSEQGATKALNYDYIPGKFIGKTKLLPGQKSWATS